MKCVSQNVMGMVSWVYQNAARGCSSLSRKVSEAAFCVFSGISSFLPCFSSKRQIALPPKEGAPNSQKKTASLASDANLGRINPPPEENLKPSVPNPAPSSSLPSSSKAEPPVVEDDVLANFPGLFLEDEGLPISGHEDDPDLKKAIEESKKEIPRERKILDAAPDYKRSELDDAARQRALWAELQSGKREESADGGEELTPPINQDDLDMQRALEESKGEILSKENALDAAPVFVMNPDELELQRIRLLELQSENVGESADGGESLIPAINGEDSNFQRALEESLRKKEFFGSPSRTPLPDSEAEDDPEFQSVLEKSKLEQFGKEREVQDEELEEARACDQSKAAIEALEKKHQKARTRWEEEVLQLNHNFQELTVETKQMIAKFQEIDRLKVIAERNKDDWENWKEEDLIKLEDRLGEPAKKLLDVKESPSFKNLYVDDYLRLRETAEGFSSLSDHEREDLRLLGVSYETFSDQIETLNRLAKSVIFWKELRGRIMSNQQASSSASSSEGIQEMPQVEQAFAEPDSSPANKSDEEAENPLGE